MEITVDSMDDVLLIVYRPSAATAFFPRSAGDSASIRQFPARVRYKLFLQADVRQIVRLSIILQMFTLTNI